MPAYQAIRRYLEAAGRPLETLPPDARLFAISSTTLYDTIRRYGKQIGIDDMGVHTLRHTAAKLRRKDGATLEQVQQLLGHSSIATTARYLAQMETASDPGWHGVMHLISNAGGKGEGTA